MDHKTNEVMYQLGNLFEVLRAYDMTLNIETVIDPLTRKSNHEFQLAHGRNTPEFEAKMEGRSLLGLPIPSHARKFGVYEITEARPEAFPQFVLPSTFWATDLFYYREFPVVDFPEPPHWATCAVYARNIV